MNKYLKLIGGILLLVVLIGGSTLLYNKFAKDYKQNNLVGIGNAAMQPENGAAAGTENGEATGNGMVNDTTVNNGEMTENSDNATVQGDMTGNNAETGSDNSVSEENTGATEDTTTGNDTTTAQTPENDTTAQAAPGFTVFNEAEEAISLSDLQGKPVVINFWASWCGPCKSEMPMFQDMYDTYGEELHFMMVNMTDGSRETVETAQAYIVEAGYTFPVYYDTDLEAAYAYYVSSVPATYFIDAEGNFVAYGLGALDEDAFMTGLEMLGIVEE